MFYLFFKKFQASLLQLPRSFNLCLYGMDLNLLLCLVGNGYFNCLEVSVTKMSFASELTIPISPLFIHECLKEMINYLFSIWTYSNWGKYAVGGLSQGQTFLKLISVFHCLNLSVLMDDWKVLCEWCQCQCASCLKISTSPFYLYFLSLFLPFTL